MPNKSERRKARSFRRTASGTKMINVIEKHGKMHCALCQKPLHGVPHGKNSGQKNKLSKSQKRPSVPFGGILCSPCRTRVTSETAKVKAGIKTIHDVDLTVRPYLTQLEKRVVA